MHDCAMIIHGRRMPSDGIRMESIIGAQKNLNVQGNMAMAVMVAVSALEWPASLSVARRAIVANPQGKP